MTNNQETSTQLEVVRMRASENYCRPRPLLLSHAHFAATKLNIKLNRQISRINNREEDLVEHAFAPSIRDHIYEKLSSILIFSDQQWGQIHNRSYTFSSAGMARSLGWWC